MDGAGLLQLIDATWPAARFEQRGPLLLRHGQRGGNRVSAATLSDGWSEADIDLAERAQAKIGQPALFMVLPGQEDLDAALVSRGYALHEPVALWTCPVELLTDLAIPRVTIFAHWEPLAITCEIWAIGGIGPERVAIMGRVPGPKAALLARRNDQPAGAGFVACNGNSAMVHAVEICLAHRRHGMGAWLMRGAAHWAAAQGAQRLTVLCTRANTAANALYASLGMVSAGGYHYRIRR